MKIKIADIDRQGVIQSRDCIKSSLWDIDSEAVKVVDNITLACEFESADSYITVKGKAYLMQDIKCSRCLQRVKRDKTVDLFFSYDKNNLGKFLEIDQDVREEILLQWPLKPLCRNDCRGICPGCGKDLNLQECTCDSKKKGVI
jgi:uncharacterized protein